MDQLNWVGQARAILTRDWTTDMHLKVILIPISKYFSEIFYPSHINLTNKTLKRTLNRSSDRRKSRNSNKVVKYFRVGNKKKQLVRGIQELVRGNTRSTS